MSRLLLDVYITCRAKNSEPVRPPAHDQMQPERPVVDSVTMLQRAELYELQETTRRMCRTMSAWAAGVMTAWLLTLGPAAAQASVTLDAAAKPHVSLDTAAQAFTDASG